MEGREDGDGALVAVMASPVVGHAGAESGPCFHERGRHEGGIAGGEGAGEVVEEESICSELSSLVPTLSMVDVGAVRSEMADADGLLSRALSVMVGGSQELVVSLDVREGVDDPRRCVFMKFGCRCLPSFVGDGGWLKLGQTWLWHAAMAVKVVTVVWGG